MMRTVLYGAAFGATLLVLGCGSRPAEWDTPVAGTVSIGKLRNAAVLVDESLNRAMVVGAQADQRLSMHAVPIGKRVATTVSAEDGSRVFVLSQGVANRLSASDEGPALTVIEADHPTVGKRYELPDALTSLAIDPSGKFAVVYAGSSLGGSFIKNPNELIFVDLTRDPAPKENPRLRTLPSNVGGAPVRLTFTPPLHFTTGDRRMLVVETDRDVMLVDIDDPTRPEVSLPISDSHSDPRPLSPAGIAVFAGNPQAAKDHPPVVAVRTSTDDNVLLYTLEPAGDGSTGDFSPRPNLALAGGIPTDITFVDTNQGPRLAAVVTSPNPSGVLVKVDDSQTLLAKLGVAYAQMTRVTGTVSGASSAGDQLLLWSASGGVSSVAIWDLGKVPDAPYDDIDTLKSVETLNLAGSVAAVDDVGDPSLKVLTTNSGSIYVLDLQHHKASPLEAASGVVLRYSLDGQRAWAFAVEQPQLAQIALAGPDVLPVVIDRAVEDVLEVDRDGGGKSLLVFHGLGSPNGSAGFNHASTRDTGGVTVYDADTPDVATCRRYSGILLEGLP